MKEKLLELVYACINNKTFYISSFYTGSNEKRINDLPNYLWQKKILEIPQENFYYKDYKFREQCKILRMKFEDSEPRYFNAGLTISFKDQPSVEIRWFNKILSEVQKKETIHVESKKIERTWWGKNKELIVDEPQEIIVKEQEVELWYKISSGSISAEITEDEFNEIIEQYQENKTKFKNQYDLKKINERIEKYKL